MSMMSETLELTSNTLDYFPERYNLELTSDEYSVPIDLDFPMLIDIGAPAKRMIRPLRSGVDAPRQAMICPLAEEELYMQSAVMEDLEMLESTADLRNGATPHATEKKQCPSSTSSKEKPQS